MTPKACEADATNISNSAHIALFQPDIPQNTGAIMRLASCFNMALDIIEPCGFVFSQKQWQRSAMDYRNELKLHRHDDWQAFTDWQKNKGKRLILFTTKTNHCYDAFDFNQDDVLLFGNESSGAPEYVHQHCDARLLIPIHARSLNLAMSAAIATAYFHHHIRKKHHE